MTDRPKRLDASFVDVVTEVGRYGDGRGGHGLSLLVKARKHGGLSKTFSQRITVNGKPKQIGLGAYPIITLTEARRLALENARMVRQAQAQPSTLIQALSGATAQPMPVSQSMPIPTEPIALTPSFAQVAEATINLHKQGWKAGTKTERMWRQMLETYAFPEIGDMSISSIQSAHIVTLLTPIWHSKAETARKTKQRISAVMQYAIAQGYRNDDPTQAVTAALPRGKRKNGNHAALPFDKVWEAIDYVSKSRTYTGKKLAFEFLVLTAARTSEVRGALWQEIDFQTKTWTIPAERMKAGRVHRVPLSDRAVEILTEAMVEGGDTDGLIFTDNKGKLLHQDAMRLLLKRYFKGVTMHGMRSSFRDWVAEKTDYPREIAEHALAHLEGSDTERAYRRTDYFEKRAAMMQEWSDFLRA